MEISLYFTKLSHDVQVRYMEKVRAIGLNPYPLKKEDFSTNVDVFPNITHGDIVNYLVFERSAYTKDEFKAFKSLEAYNQFVCGWVKEVLCKEFTAKRLFVAKVRIN